MPSHSKDGGTAFIRRTNGVSEVVPNRARPPPSRPRFTQELRVPPQVPAEGRFPQDPNFPHLGIATDAERMLEVFRTRLRPLADTPIEIEGCDPFRFRFSQRTSRCVLEYTLHLADPVTGRRWDTWATGVQYADPEEALRLVRDLRAQISGVEIPEAWRTFEPVAYIPELRMAVEVFPCDRKLRSLPQIMSGSLKDLDARLLEDLGAGAWRIEERSIEPVRYRTEVSAALRYTIQVRDGLSSRPETRRYFLKVYRDDRGAEAYKLLRSIASVPPADRGYAAMRPVAYLPELHTLVVGEAPGRSLSRILREVHDPVASIRKVARAVAAFNQDTLPVTGRQVLADDLRNLSRAASLVAWACPDVAPTVRAIADAVRRGLYEVPPGLIHGDLKADHIFLSRDGVTFIDLDQIALGDPVRDAAHFYAYLLAGIGVDGLAPILTTTAATAFLEEYFRHVPRDWVRRFPLQCSAVLVEIASAIFRRQEPSWPDKVAGLVQSTYHALSNWSGRDYIGVRHSSRRPWAVGA